MKAIKIQWHSEGEHGFWVSSELRFSITPNGFRNGVTPDFYELRDADTNPARITRYDTVADAKSAAVKRVAKDLERYFFPATDGG